MRCESIADAADAATARLIEQGRRYDVVVLDAPRAGARHVLGPVGELGPRAVALCSCNATTFARDAEGLTRLHLPTSAGKFRYLELVARLSVAGALEADVTQNDVLDALVRIEPVQPYPFSL